MIYADVILPLPLEGLFTYCVPENLQQKVAVRKRVLVPLGRSKTYIALVVSLHQRKPDFDCKPIVDVLDSSPILLPEQMRLWQWIADYYMCSMGDVYKAALPSGLKAEDGYRPKTETYVTLAEGYRNEQSLHSLIDSLRRAHAQMKILVAFLSMSHYDSLQDDYPQEQIVEITKDELLNESRGSAAVLRTMVERHILLLYEKAVGRLNCNEESNQKAIKQLNAAQTEAYNKVVFSFLKHNTTLLHGVTSSGKTEIYIHLIWKALQEHKQVLYLLPEIALTVQIMERLRRVFGNRLGIYHSKYSDAERVEIWQKQLSMTPYDIILGARSAVFLPFSKLGLIIIDEEHETSFKQQDPAPRYHARSAALVLASITGAKTLLGTATPSVESYYNTSIGKYGLVKLTSRFKDIELPKIEVVDVKDLRKRKIMKGLFSPVLLHAITNALANDEQVILFQNRRGFAPMIECRTCGWVPKCKNCDVSLTYHRNSNILTCHYCGYTYSVPTKCPSCEERELRTRGYGTEKIEEEIQRIFPNARLSRMDLDTTRSRKAYERIISDFSSGRSNMLIGTQMVTKGLDFDRVSVVGILNADAMLNYPDFRAYEHSFMMMAQVSGRAGRKNKQGLVVLQTSSPELPVIKQVVANDYEGFYNDLIEERKLFNYPPYCRVVCVYLKHRNDRLVDSAAQEMGARLRYWFKERVLGPDKPAVAMVKQLNIRKIVVKLENGLSLSAARKYMRQVQTDMLADKRYATLQIYYDVDPL